MTTIFSAFISATILFLVTLFLAPPVTALGGSAATIAVVYGSSTTVCSIVSNQPIQQIQCWSNGQLQTILPTTSFDFISGGRDTLCGVRSGGFSLLCWNTTFDPKRIYNDASSPLASLSIGDTQICALRNTTAGGGGNAICWRGDNAPSDRFRMISSGLGFSCGVVETGGRILCWGGGASSSIQSEFANFSMFSIYAGGSHACGISNSGTLICRGNNENGQLNTPSNAAAGFRDLAVGANHTCAIRKSNGTVICWGGNFDSQSESTTNITDNFSFESIVAGLNFTCGLTSKNFSVICWGPGWPTAAANGLPMQKTLPGPCVESPCPCGEFPDYQTLCVGNGRICSPCDTPPTISPPPLPSPPPPVITTPSPNSPSKALKGGLLAFAIVGSIGAFAGICSVIYCLWIGNCFGKMKVHNSVQPTINGAQAQHSSSNPPSRSSTLRRQASILMRRQRSGTSSIKHADKAEEFDFSDLAEATNNFSLKNKIGAGSFGVVYRGKLVNGVEVAIKRSESGLKPKKFQEKETAFESELSFLSRLHHKHLVRLVGYCDEREERLLVYEFMTNGALHDHLHSKNNVDKNSSLINSWRMRIKIALDAARGIEYLHSYAVPPIIHRDIKSSNILLDSDWVARVSDFGLSLNRPEGGGEHRPEKAAGTVGYIDPEYYGLNVLTTKSDVYGFGVVLLELLTGKRAIFKSGEEPVTVVDWAVEAIRAGEVGRVLDRRVGAAEVSELEAVELVAYTAMHCVNLEGRERPSMTDIVANLERALALCEDSHGSMSSGQISIVSD